MFVLISVSIFVDRGISDFVVAHPGDSLQKHADYFIFLLNIVRSIYLATDFFSVSKPRQNLKLLSCFHRFRQNRKGWFLEPAFHEM